MKKSWLPAVLLGMVFGASADAEIIRDIPGDAKPPMFEYRIYEEGEVTLDGLTSIRDFTKEELYPLARAGVIWDSIINNTSQIQKSKVIVYTVDDYNAYSYSPYVEYYMPDTRTLADYKITALNAVINGKKYIKDEYNQDIFDETGKYFDAAIGVGLGLSEECPGWDTSTTVSALYQGTLPPLMIVMEHEIAHALGISSMAMPIDSYYGAPYYFSTPKFSAGHVDPDRSEKMSVYDKHLRVYDSTLGRVVTAGKGMPILADLSATAEDLGFDQSEVFDVSKNAPYFAGVNAMKVASGVSDEEIAGLAEDEIIAYCEDKINDAGGLVNYTIGYVMAGVSSDYLRVNGVPINGIEPEYILNNELHYAPELSHIELRNSYMSHQNYRNWVTFMEAELAVLKDIGYDINLKDYFGKSFYLDNTVANVAEDYSLYKDQGIGVHVYGTGSDIVQTSNIATKGVGSFGVRIDGVNDKYTLDGGTIDAKGANSIGLGVTYGSGHEINIKSGSVVKASGANSSAVSFDFGKNMLGEFIEAKGSYIHTVMGENQSLDELEGALVDNFNVNGTIEASGDAENAIYISQNAYVKNINIQKDAKIKGAIVSRWNSERSGDYGPVQSREKLYTNLNFGADNNGNLDQSYVGNYSGKIDGNSVVGSETKNTLKMNLAGTLNIDNADISVFNVNNSGTIRVNEKLTLSSLDKQNSINGDGRIDVVKDATLTLGKNTQNVSNSVNLANNAELSTINQSQDSHTIKQLNSQSDSKLSFDLGDAFNLENTSGNEIQLSQVKVDEETVKNLQDGQTYKIFQDESQVIDLIGGANIYYDGNKYGITQDSEDATKLKVDWLGYSSGLREAAEDASTANYINTEVPQPFDGGTVVGNTFEVSGLDVDFNNKYDGLIVDGVSNPGGTTIKTSFYGGKSYNLKVQNGGILTVDSIDQDILVGRNAETAFDINKGSVNLAANNNKITVGGKISGTDKSTDNINILQGNNIVELNSVSNVTATNNSDYAVLNGENKDVDWKLNSGVLRVKNDAYLSSDKTNSVTFNGGTLNLANNLASEITLAKMELNTDANVVLDIDVAGKKADTFVFDDASNIITNDNKLVISNANFVNPKEVLTDSSYEIPFISSEYKNEALLGKVSSTTGSQVMTPIYKYGLGYSENGSAGNIMLNRSNTGGYADYNPAIFASTVGSHVGGYLTQLNSYDMAFGNMDMLMSMPTAQRNALKYKNKYAIADNSKLMTYSPNQIPEENKGFWFKPFATYENVSLKDGPKVENAMYSSFFGGESDITEHRNGWNSVVSGYVGYNGSHQRYDGVSIYQNGGQIGATGMLYKDRFFAGITANAGLGVGDASTMYGDEDFSMLHTGAAIKTGYNFGYKDDKIILQPSLLASYSFINTYDYTNAAGVRIKPDDLHGFGLAPGVKLIGNLPNSWQPYVSVQFVWNMLSDSNTNAGGVKLDNFKIKPYLQYGVGVQKRVGDRFTGYLQAMGRNIGRDGVALSAGMRWSLGRKTEKL